MTFYDYVCLKFKTASYSANFFFLSKMRGKIHEITYIKQTVLPSLLWESKFAYLEKSVPRDHR